VSKHCEDCGTRMSSGRCPNCQEELVIYEDQILTAVESDAHRDEPVPISPEFMNKVSEQREEVERRKREIRS